MYVTDWQQWCVSHHIKLKGIAEYEKKKDNNQGTDRRTNAGSGYRSIRGAGMEAPGHGNGRKTGYRDL